MESTKRKWLLPFLWPNVAVAVVVLFLLLTKQITSLGQFTDTLGYALLYSNLVSIFAILIVGMLAKRFAWSKLPLVPLLLFCVLVLVPIGCLLVQALLTSFGVMPWRYFWSQYFSTIRTCIPLSAIFGLGAFVHSSLRERLEVTEQKLREKELAAERARKRAVEARLQSLEARIRPHFLFNTLNSISSLIASDPARAEQIVGRLATLLRTSLDTSERPLISLGEELAIVQSYIDIEKARFGDRLGASFDVPGDLEEAKVPPMTIQSLVENAVKHGISSKPAGGDIRVAASADHGNLRIEVSDSGPGFDLAVVPPDHGLENLVERLNALFGERARLHVAQRGERCVVEMVLPQT